MATDAEQLKTGGGNLIRHSSSPAGFFAHLNVDNGTILRFQNLSYLKFCDSSIYWNYLVWIKMENFRFFFFGPSEVEWNCKFLFAVFAGYGVMRGIAGFRNGNEGWGVAGIGPGNRLKSQLSFSSRQSSGGLLSQISQIENESMGGYPTGSWEESSILSENNFPYSGLKRPRDNLTDSQVYFAKLLLLFSFICNFLVLYS